MAWGRSRKRQTSHGFNESGASNGAEETAAPLNRRIALKALVGGAAAAALGAVALARPEKARADNTDSFSTTSSIPAVTATSSGGFAVAIQATNNSGRPAIDATSMNPGNSQAPYAVRGTWNGSSGYGVYGTTDDDQFAGVFGENIHAGEGVRGFSATGTGVHGRTSGDSGAAVWGESTSSGFGVLGSTTSATHAGVTGSNSGSGAGVRGENTASGNGVRGTTSSSAAGVRGENSGTGQGVLGTNSGSGPGMLASNTGTGTGLTAISNSSAAAVQGLNAGNGSGVYGNTNFTGIPAIQGVHGGTGDGVRGDSAGGRAIHGVQGTGSTTGHAGYFDGRVTVTGDFTVLGFKAAAVRGADGALRRLYSLESPESYFEDFGAGQLSGSSATVQVAPDFAAVVKSDNYFVFITPEGEPKGPLYISNKTPTSFTVRDAGASSHDNGNGSDIPFSYRIVAKRKDIAGLRLEHVDEPEPSAPPIALNPPTVPLNAGGTDG